MAKEKIDYTLDLPLEPAPEVYDYLVKKNALKHEALIYSVAWITGPLTGQKRKMVKVKCTACGEETYQEYVSLESGCWRGGSTSTYGYIDPMTNRAVQSGSDALCISCGAEAHVYHISRFNHGDVTPGHADIMTVHVINGRLTLLYWIYEVFFNKEGKRRINILRHSGYIADGRKLGYVSGYCKYFSTVMWLGNWENRCKLYDNMGEPSYIYPFNEELLAESNHPNCKLDVYVKTGGTRPVQYLKVYVKHPNVENLIMQGLAKFFDSCLEGISYYSNERHFRKELYNFKATKPHEILKLSKEEYVCFKRNRWYPDKLKMCQTLRSEYRLSDIEEMLRLATPYEIEALLELDEIPVLRALRYIERQKKRAQISDKGLINTRYYSDYIRMAETSGEDLKDDSVLFPQNIINAHDYEVTRQKYRESQALKKGFKDRYKILREYEFEDNETGLVIFACKNEKQLHDEGKILHHCVGTYASRHANGDTNIFFIRHISDPDRPYFTLELNEHSRKAGKFAVVQNRGRNNCVRSDDVKAFEDKWKSFVENKLKTEGIKENGRKPHNRSRSA